jgi:hypothetical protein
VRRLGAGQRLRVLDVVPFEEEDESPFVGLLKVRPVGSSGGARDSREKPLPRNGVGGLEARSA